MLHEPGVEIFSIGTVFEGEDVAAAVWYNARTQITHIEDGTTTPPLDKAVLLGEYFKRAIVFFG